MICKEPTSSSNWTELDRRRDDNEELVLKVSIIGPMDSDFDEEPGNPPLPQHPKNKDSIILKYKFRRGKNPTEKVFTKKVLLGSNNYKGNYFKKDDWEIAVFFDVDIDCPKSRDLGPPTPRRETSTYIRG